MKLHKEGNTPITTLMLIASLIGGANASVTIVNGDFSDFSGLTPAPSQPGIVNGIPAGWSWSGAGFVQLIDYSLADSPSPTVASGSYLESGTLEMGVLSQTITGLNSGQSYLLTFDWGNRRGGSEHFYDFDISIAGETFSRAGQTFEDMQVGSLAFTASSASEILAISLNDPTSNTNGAFDNFAIEAVPEPSSALLLGMGILGFTLRRSRN